MLALTGENRAFSGGGDALITSGNAFAAANILNIANTNVIGANWVLAMVNIFGDWSGSLSFGEPDLWIGTAVEAPRSPLEAGDELTYHFTVANHGDARASNVWLRASALGDLLVFDPIFLDTRGDARLFVGSLAPGEVRELTLAGRLDTPLPFGTHTIDHTFTLTSYEPETNRADNTETLSLLAYGGEALVSESGGSDAGRGGGGGSSGGSSSTSGGGGGGGGIYYTSPANLAIAKRNSATAPVPAGSSVDYTVVIKNDGLGEAYHAVLVDVLKDAGGAVIHEERWNLETIYPAEEVTVTYTIEFSADAAAGTYTNSAYVKAYDGHPSLDPFYGSAADSPTVTSTVEIVGTSSSSGGGAQSGGAAVGTSANSQSNVPSSPATPPGSGVLQTHNETATSATAATAATSSSLTVAGGTGTTSASSLAVAGQQSIVEIGAGARAFTPSLPAPVTHVVAARGIAEAPRGAIAFDERGTPASESGTPFALSDGSDTLSGDLRDEAAQYPLVQAGDSAETDVSPLSGLAPWRQGAIAGLTHAAAAFLSGLPIPSAILLSLFLVILLLVGVFILTRPAQTVR